jgi:ribosome maturation factor RimP
VLSAEVLEELDAIAHGSGCELIHGELKGGTLRLFIDREGGVNLADCETVSRQASAFLDLIDFGSGRYLLEVSSPGLDRQLYGPRDYERFTGHRVRVTFRSPVSGEKRTIRGSLEGFEPGGESFATLVDEQTGERLRLPLEAIEVARLELEP